MKIGIVHARRAAAAVGFAAVMLALVLLVQATGAYALFTGGTVRKLPIYSVEREDKKVAISFDCAWGTDHTDAILETLAKANVHATFFMVEFWAEKYPEYVKKIDEAGHEIGTHSSTHSYMSKLSEADIRRELQTSSEAITAITGKPVEVFRAPFGDYDDLLIETAKDMGLYTIQWDVDSLDWKDLSASEITLRIVGKAKSGSIILCHNNGLHTAEALPAVLATLQNSGYEFVPVGELIYRDHFTVDANGRQHSAS